MSNNNAKQTKTKTETEENCPPGMKWDANAGKCVDAEKFKKEETNAGDTTSVGAGTNVDADTSADTNPHDCPEGTSWDGEKCAPSGDQAGSPGGGGTGDASTPGKESLEQFYKQIERLQAAHTSYNENLLEQWKNHEQKLLEMFANGMGMPIAHKESAAFGVKNEAYANSGVSSKVNDAGYDEVYKRTVAEPAAFFESAKKGINDLTNGFISWSIQPEAYYKTLQKGWINYGNNQAHGKAESEVKKEGFTITAGDMPQIFSKQVYLIPGGRMRVPIRQFLDTQIIEDADRFNWYKVNGFDFDDTTSEGTEPTTEEAQTVTKVTGLPTATRANITVNYSDIENAPFDLIEAFNRAAALGALDAEAREVLDTEYASITPTNWVNGNTGAAITTDDAASMTLQQEGIYGGMQLIQNQGGDTSPGNMVFFVHPKGLRELILDTAADFFTGQNPLHSTAVGVLENRLGADIVATNRVHAQDNTTNDTFQNILAMKGAIGLAVAADLQIEAQRRPDLNSVKIGARHRIDSKQIDETMTARVSSAQ